MQFISLYKKNYLLWTRNLKGSLCELLFPLLFTLIIYWIKSQVLITDYKEKSFETQKMPTQISQFTEPPFSSQISQRMKNCNLINQGGKVALIPKNELTEELENFFTTLNYPVIYFKNNQEMSKYILQDNYLEKDENGKVYQICLAIQIDKYDKQNNQYEYKLRFNVTNPEEADHIDTREDLKIPFKIYDEKEASLPLQLGTLTLQYLIEGFIIKKALPLLNIDASVRLFKVQEHKEADFKEIPLLLLFSLGGTISFIRIIQMVVQERESKAIQNMENMGMRKINYILAAISFHYSVYFLYSFLLIPLIKILILKNTNIFIIFIIYYLFQFTYISIGYLVSDFFSNTKRAVIMGVVVFFVLYFISILIDNFSSRGEFATAMLALSPIAGLEQATNNLLISESSFNYFSFGDLDVKINNFRIITFIIIMVIEWIVFTLLAIYCFFVIPQDTGVAEHPLFFLGFKNKSNKIIQLQDIEKQNSQNFEQVEKEFFQQKENKENISIEKLSKIYPNGKIAVKNLNLEIYQNQIFSLLGHNGAGKTTTISMISGLLQKTKGSITIKGLDSDQDRKKIKKQIGVCPQVNPIFDYMTVNEHMTLYSQIKGIQNKIQNEIDEVLKDIDLFHKKNYQAKFLSGGQKRKLCVALSFVGGSSIILLDEPTSGMDTYARRLLWEMIKKYKQDRIIILTTHNMDEADYLGDRIGIMAEGELVACGSSLFLKKKFGIGYQLTIVKGKGMGEGEVKVLSEKFKGICGGVEFVSDVGSELKYSLPQSEIENFQRLFFFLENDKELNIESFGIGLTTLEEVFLKVASLSEEQAYKKELKKQQSLGKVKSQKEFFKFEENKEIKNKNLEQLRQKNNFALFTQQIKALFVKRLIFFKRDWISIFCQILIPLLIITAGLALTKITFIDIPPIITISPEIYPNNLILHQKISPVEKLVQQFPPYLNNIKYFGPLTEDQFYQKTFEKRSSSQNYSIFFNEISQNNLKYTTYFNSTGPAGAYIAPNLIHNSILKDFTNNKNAYINLQIDPLDYPEGVKNLEDTANGFILTILFALGFSFIPSSMVIFVIKEREFNSKHQQLISGMNILPYWISNFLVDYLKYLVVAIFTLILVFVFNVKTLNSGDVLGMFVLLLIFYGFSFLPFVYLVSFFFKKPAKGQVLMFLVSFITGMFLVIFAFVLRLVEESRDLSKNVLEFIFRMIPFFTFHFGILNIANLKLFRLVFEYKEEINAFSTDGALWDLLFLIFTGIFYWFLVFCVEFSFKIQKNIKIFNMEQIKQEIQKEEKEDPVEQDVLDEQENVKSLDIDKYDIIVKDLIKVYQISNNPFCGKKNIQYKTAIKKISFGVEHGNVFGLLGTNGAGKTSCFKILTGDTFPNEGESLIKGYKMPENMIKIRHLIGYCPQFDSLLENLTTEEHLNLYCDLKGIHPKYKKHLVNQMIDVMNLKKFRNTQAGTYSGGNKRKLSVAIALIGKPPIVFLDEPSSGMDPYARRFMWSIISDISTNQKNSTVVLTTHSMEEAEALSTKLAIMVEGKIKTIGSIQQLKNKYGDALEVEVKLQKISKEDLEEEMEKVEGGDMDLEGIGNLLRERGQGELYGEISLGGKGKNIFQILKTRRVRKDVLLEWVMLVERNGFVREQLDLEFGCEVLESFQRISRFKLENEVKLSGLFGFLNDNRERLRMDNYSVRQISLEQIFIKFAQNIHHDD